VIVAHDLLVDRNAGKRNNTHLIDYIDSVFECSRLVGFILGSNFRRVVADVGWEHSLYHVHHEE
jgi:hypothetical protein